MFRKKYLGFLALSLLAGCQYLPKLSESTHPSQLSPDQVADIYHQEQLFLAIDQHVGQLAGVQMTVHTQVDLDGNTVIKDQKSTENYDQGQLTGLYMASQSSQAIAEEVLINEGEYAHRYLNRDWVQLPSQTKLPLSYSSLLNSLILGQDPVQVVSDLEAPIYQVEKKLTAPQLLSDLPWMLDLPMMVSPQADIQAQASYQVDKALGQIQSAKLHITVEDLGKTYVVDISSQVSFSDQVHDLDSLVSKNDDNQDLQAMDLEAFNQANPASSLTYYEMVTHTSLPHEADTAYLHIFNPWLDQPHLELRAPLEGENLDPLDLVYQNQIYGLRQDQLIQEDYSQVHPYHYFVRHFTEVYDDLIAIEGDPDQDYTYREIFEDNFDGFQKAVGQLDVTPLSREDFALYAIDYHLDPTNLTLTHVTLWSLTEADEEEVDHVISLAFSHFNLYSPQAYSDQLDPALWQAANP